MTIYEQAEQLGKALAQTQEFIHLQSAEQAKEQDEIAVAMMEKFQERRTELMMMAQKPDITKEELTQIRDDMQAETEKLMSNETLSTYFTAVAAFDSLMKQVNNLIAREVMPEQSDSCGGDCGSCGGCH